MRQIVFGGEVFFHQWIAAQVGGDFRNSRGPTISLWDTSRDIPLASTLFEDFNGSSLLAHIAAAPGENWASREYLRAIFSYPFQQLRARVIIAPIGEGNLRAQKFVERLGFFLSASLPNSHPSGALNLFLMPSETCRWL